MSIEKNKTINTETNDLAPEWFEQFERLIGSELWIKCRDDVIKHNHGGFWNRESKKLNEFPLALSLLSDKKKQYGKFPKLELNYFDVFECIQTIKYFLDYYHSVDPKFRGAAIEEMRGAINNPDKLRATRLEWFVAASLRKMGFEVTFAEQIKIGRFDLLANKDGAEVEIECKSFSGDIGKKLHQRDISKFGDILQLYLRKLVAGMNNGIVAELILPARMPSDRRKQEELCRVFFESMLSAKDVDPGKLRVVVRKFDTSGIFDDVPLNVPPKMRIQIAKLMLVNRLGLADQHIFSAVNDNGGFMLAAIKSKDRDDQLQKMLRIIGSAEKQQLTGRRSGVIVARIEALSRFDFEKMFKPSRGPAPPGSIKAQGLFFIEEVGKFVLSRTQNALCGVSFLSKADRIIHLPGPTSYASAVLPFKCLKNRYFCNAANDILEGSGGAGIHEGV